MNRNTTTPENELITVINEIRDPTLIFRFFKELLTETELKDLSLRWELLKKLHDGISQRKIASELGISLCKITRGSKLLKDRHSAVNQIIQQHFS